jgi:formylmethanofuran dehydrogenase subunit E
MTLEPQTDHKFVHRTNIDRYKKILATYLTDDERHFVERRLAEEQASLEQPDSGLASREVFSCPCVDEMPTPATRSFICQCAQCDARIWVAHSSPIEPIRLCRSCAKTQETKGAGRLIKTSD